MVLLFVMAVGKVIVLENKVVIVTYYPVFIMREQLLLCLFKKRNDADLDHSFLFNRIIS